MSSPRGHIRSRPASCSAASARIMEAYAIRTSGLWSLSLATISSMGHPASMRSLAMNGLRRVAATRAE